MDITLNDDIQLPESFVVKGEDGESIDYAQSITSALGALNNVTGIEIPEKLRVTQEGSESIDLGGSLSKVIGSYTELEKRLGSGEAPPKDPDGYKVDFAKLPEGMGMTEEAQKDFLKSMHGAGVSNKAAQAIVDYYGGILKGAQENLGSAQEKLVTDYLKGKHDESMSALKETYGEENMEALTGFANKVAEKFGEKLSDDEKKSLVENPAILKLLVEIGSEIIPEDKPVMTGGKQSDTDIKAIMEDPEGPYWNSSHPDHKKTLKMVNEYYAKTYGKK